MANLEGRLDERVAQRDAATQERDRLQVVEAELTKVNNKLTADIASLKTSHQSELDGLVDARWEVEEGLQKERDAAVRKLEADTQRHQEELDAAKRQARMLVDGMHELDDLLAGKPRAPIAFW